MPFALLLALVAIAGATLLTYLYEREALLWSRLCAGACVGWAALGLVGFVLASALGMTPLTLALAGAVTGAPLLLLARSELRARVRADVWESARVVGRTIKRPGKGADAEVVFYIAAAFLFWLVFDRAMYVNAGGVFTGVDNNIGDLPFHLSIITGFAYGENFPPQHPEFAGVKLTYPFIVDFMAAMFVRAGATLEGALFWQNFVLALSLTGLLHRWAWKLTRVRAAALITPALVILSGGFGWFHFFKEALAEGRGVFGMLGKLEHDYTVMGHFGYRWGNAVTTLLIPQRGMLLGIPLALVVWTLWWQATGKEEEEGAEGKRGRGEREEGRKAKGKKPKGKGDGGKKAGAGGAVRVSEEGHAVVSARGSKADASLSFPPLSLFPSSPLSLMIAAGLVAGLLPLVHAHSFVVLMVTGGLLSLLFADWRGASDGEAAAGGFSWAKWWQGWRPWAAFFTAAVVVAVPQMWWATKGSAVRAGQFFGWEFGWDSGDYNVFWFWIKNTAVFIPLLVAALLWRGREPVVRSRLLYFYLPFTLCFIVPNVYKLSPWVWDNIKVLFYWWIASAPLVALVLARLWRRGGALRVAALVLLSAQTLAGGLDVWRVASRASEQQTYDTEGLAFAEVVRRETPPRALILHAPTYNDPVFLTGRRSFLGYPGHVWSHGLDYKERESELQRIYSGAADAAHLLTKNGIEYVVVGPLEEVEMRKAGLALRRPFFERYAKVGEAGEYRLYKTSP
ncbi:MAG TPA: hypothetical protein VFS10_11690 [Pyrinomonadaceae bacterium]|nr:hypothetical protein [Pyrinomonadaceae bacterium]